MHAAEWIRDYGYYAIVAGTFFEGELVMLAAGMAACAAYLSLPAVIFAGMAGIFASDTFCFLLGRLGGERLRRWFPRLHARLGPVFRMIERHDEHLIIYFQFFPGLCAVTPVAFGMTRIPLLRFMAFDLLGNAFWTLVFSLGGYAFGTAFERLVRGAHRWEPVGCGLLAIAGLVIWLVSRSLGKRAATSSG